jgi:methyl-accepting chemotaxis protein
MSSALAHSNKFRMRISAVLHALFGLMLSLIAGVLLLPIHRDIEQRADGQTASDNTRAARAVFAALQALRIERGPTRTTLERPEPASAEFIAITAEYRADSAPALARVLGECAITDCAGSKKTIVAGLPNSLEKLLAIRKEVDSALRVPLSNRRANIAADFNAASTDIIDRLEGMFSFLDEKVRMVDAEAAELIAIKQLAWLARDGLGLERNFIVEGLNGGKISPSGQKRAIELRGQAEVTWPLVRRLGAREGVPKEVVDAIQAAHGEAFETYEQIRKAAYEAIVSGQPARTSSDELIKSSNLALDRLAQVSNVALAAAERHALLKIDEANRNLMVHGAVLALALLVGLAGFVVVMRRVTRPIRAITDIMRRLADGDATVAIPGTARRDEIGDMAAAVEVFKENAIERQRLAGESLAAKQRAGDQRKIEMRKIAAQFEGAVGRIVKAVSSSVDELHAVAGTLVQAARTTQKLAENAASASEDASKNVLSVSTTTEEITASATDISLKAQQATAIAGEAVLQAQKTSADVSQLSHAGERIGAVVKLISDIAEQTNLLALNATIEAARAGEAGRGFAVVASEVKSLATQTGNATKEIGTQIAAMQAATQEAVLTIKGIDVTIGKVSEISRVIHDAIEQHAAATQDIARYACDAGGRATEVSRDISTVSHQAFETGSASGQVLSAAQVLSDEASKLRTEVERFLTELRVAG